jgi:hypothetical protein
LTVAARPRRGKFLWEWFDMEGNDRRAKTDAVIVGLGALSVMLGLGALGVVIALLQSLGGFGAALDILKSLF